VFPPGKNNEEDTRLTYLGRWDPGRGFEDSFGKTVSFSNDKTAEIRFEFQGSAFVYGFSKAFNRGRAQIWIDGKLVGDLDQYSPDVRWQSEQRIAAQQPGRHFVSIRVTGEKNPNAKDAFVDLDFFIVEP
jgi:hypothetical protein